MKKVYATPALLSAAVCSLVLVTVSTAGSGRPNENTLLNATAYITSQCYTKTEGEGVPPRIHNPCFSCHTDPVRPNYLDDGGTQLSYAFPDAALVNPWTNLFEDRTDAVNAISDQEIMAYVRTDNYFDENGNIKLVDRLANLPPAWDDNANGQWDGFVPDCYFNFDSEGFDRIPSTSTARSGGDVAIEGEGGHPGEEGESGGNGRDGGREPPIPDYTGWRAFGYYPFLGTFWPTNGSTDDVLIRLPEVFRTNRRGHFDITVYKVNLAIVEAMLKEADVVIDEVDERRIGRVDIDKDGRIGKASLVKYDWAPLEDRYMSYVGKAKRALEEGRVQIAAGLYPQGTEFLHTVRYIDFTEDGDNRLAARMKEVRYAKKLDWLNYSQLREKYFNEFKERQDFPDRIKLITGNREEGVGNDLGWILAAFIEDELGELRPQSYEELVFCVGCHGYVGAVRDNIYSFHRKFDAAVAPAHGWYHWTQQGLKGVPERIRSDGNPDYGFYLQTNGAGDEFRNNDEVMAKFFDVEGNAIAGELQKLEGDVSLLLFASPERAMMMNKAYRVIVDEQSFIKGRDAHVAPVQNVHVEVEQDTPTGIITPVPGY